MKIFLFSDWQEQPIDSVFESIERENMVDAVVYAGDNLERFQQKDGNKLEELAQKTKLGKVLAVGGNMDKAKTAVFDSEKVQNLHKEPFQFEDKIFLGLNGHIESWTEEELYRENKTVIKHLKEQYRGYEEKSPILVSHQPPNRILDIASKISHKHIGSKAVRKFIEQENIDLTICGHCHQFGGRAREKDFGTVINIASPENSSVKGRYGIVEITEGSIDYRLKTTEKGVDHELLNLKQVGENRLEQFQGAGITELDDIKEENKEKLKELPGVYDWHVKTWLSERKAIINEEIAFTSEEEFEFLEEDNLVLLDIETALGGGRTWLIGLYSIKEGEFTQIFEKDNEKKLLKDFIEYIDSKENPTIVYYSNCKFDVDTLRNRMIENGLENQTVVLKSSVDLGIKVQNQLLGRFSKSNLKDICEYLADFEFTYDELDGFDVGSMYSKYILDGVEPNWDKLLEYNKDDVMSLKAVVERLRDEL